MKLRLHQIVVSLGYAPDDVQEAVARRLAVSPMNIVSVDVVRRSLDARGNDRPPRYVLTVDVEVNGAPGDGATPPPDEPIRPPFTRKPSTGHRPIVVGAGPAGLMSALELAEAGHRPLVLERGDPTALRHRRVEAFWQDGRLDEDSNVLFGEGGAGLFSDGKLTARAKDRWSIRRFFDVLVACGAPPDILVDAEPHLGSDVLVEAIPRLRERIETLGGDVRFSARLTDLHVENGTLRGLVAGGIEYETDACFLATGHSARDVYRLLDRRTVVLQAKPFAVGVRIELPQRAIDRAQFGRWAGRPPLTGASFRLTRRGAADARNCYSFCMCPGGLVLACASTDGELTTNGMSFSGRAKPFGNAAFLVPIEPSDLTAFSDESPFAGLTLQRRIEQSGFEAGGGDYGLPAQRLADFLAGRASSSIPAERSCVRAVPANVSDLLPDAVRTTLCRSLPSMLRELDGVRLEDALVYGPETRSTSPVRIARDPATGGALHVRGLYPIGEGAGYAGGIVSSALDGMAAAARWLA